MVRLTVSGEALEAESWELMARQLGKAAEVVNGWAMDRKLNDPQGAARPCHPNICAQCGGQWFEMHAADCGSGNGMAAIDVVARMTIREFVASGEAERIVGERIVALEDENDRQRKLIETLEERLAGLK